MQRALARSTGDIAVTAYLDREASLEKKEQVDKATKEVIKFLETGQVGELTLNEFKKKVAELLLPYPQAQGATESLMVYLSTLKCRPETLLGKKVADLLLRFSKDGVLPATESWEMPDVVDNK